MSRPSGNTLGLGTGEGPPLHNIPYPRAQFSILAAALSSPASMWVCRSTHLMTPIIMNCTYTMGVYGSTHVRIPIIMSVSGARDCLSLAYVS